MDKHRVCARRRASPMTSESTTMAAESAGPPGRAERAERAANGAGVLDPGTASTTTAPAADLADIVVDSTTEVAADSVGSDFAGLARRIADSGLLKRRPGYYVARIGGVVGLYAAAWVAFAFIGDSWWQLLTAAALGVLYSQVALVAHDIAHRQVFRLRRPTEIAGRLVGRRSRNTWRCAM